MVYVDDISGAGSKDMIEKIGRNLRKMEETKKFTFNLDKSLGGYLVYLSDGDVPFFRVSFRLFFSRTGYQKKANFLEQVVKTCQKRKFCYYLIQFWCF